MREFTENQKRAIASKKSVIVSASAGTGKTATLTERIVRQLLSGYDIRNMLVITFSKKAAEEMRTRITARLNEELEKVEAEVTSRIKTVKRKSIVNQINMLSSASIETVHAFCTEIIKQNYLLAGVDPDFRVISGSRLAVLEKNTMDSVMEPEYKADKKELSILSEYAHPSSVEKFLLNCYKKINAVPGKFGWFDNEIEKYNISVSEIPEDIKEYLINTLEDAKSDFDQAGAYLDPTDSKSSKAQTILNGNIRAIDAAISCIKSSEIGKINKDLFLFKYTQTAPEQSLVYISNAKKKLKIFEDFNMASCLEHIKAMYPMLRYMSDVLKVYDTAIMAAKKERKVIDFSDMEHLACKILEDPSIADFYKNRYQAVYVDEYQDTSLAQEQIINAVSREDNLFCVGDFKQSIYRFRHSNPAVFKNRLESYTADPRKDAIYLNSNFRSAANILACTNDVFEYIINGESEISYGDDDALSHGRNDNNNVTPVHVSYIEPSDNNDEAEIVHICETIKKRMEQPIYDSETGETRPAKYSDFAVLSRKIIRYTENFNRIFRAYKIPFTILKTGDLFETEEIKLLTAMLKVTISSRDDLSLLTVMHNGLFSFDDDDIYNVRTIDDTAYLMDNMKMYAKQGNVKAKEFLSFLDLCEMKRHSYSVAEMVSYIVSRTYIKDVVASYDNADHRLRNIQEFINLAHEYEKTGCHSLYAFLKEVYSVGGTDAKIEEAGHAGRKDAVTITSIHQSKGLEYPIVILAFTGNKFTSSKSPQIIIDSDAGVGANYIDNDNNVRDNTLRYKMIEKEYKFRSKEEELRILYVAMTRAKEELYIQGVVDFAKALTLAEPESMIDCIALTNNRYLSKAGSWEVRVVAKEEIPEAPTGVTKQSFPVVPVALPPKHVEKTRPVPKSISPTGEGGLVAFRKPRFTTGTTQADIGSSVHLVMKWLNIKYGMTVEEVGEQVDAMLAKGLITEEDRINIDEATIQHIAALTNCECFKKVETADALYKEKKLYTKTEENGHSILVKCIVDLAAENRSEICIIDYKTDSDTSYNGALSHKDQLLTYKKCLEETYGKPVTEMYVAMVNAGICHKI